QDGQVSRDEHFGEAGRGRSDAGRHLRLQTWFGGITGACVRHARAPCVSLKCCLRLCYTCTGALPDCAKPSDKGSLVSPCLITRPVACKVRSSCFSARRAIWPNANCIPRCTTCTGKASLANRSPSSDWPAG